MQLTLRFTALFRRIAPYTREIRLAKIHFFRKKRPVFRRPAEAPLAETSDTCRPHQNEVFMRNERINTSFFCIFDRFMRSKMLFFDKNSYFWRPHLNIVFPLIAKALQVLFSKSFFRYEIKIQTAPNPFGSS